MVDLLFSQASLNAGYIYVRVSQEKKEIASQVMYKRAYMLLIRDKPTFRESRSNHATVKLTTQNV